MIAMIGAEPGWDSCFLDGSMMAMQLYCGVDAHARTAEPQARRPRPIFHKIVRRVAVVYTVIRLSLGSRLAPLTA